MRRDASEPVYYIGVAARLLSSHPQTLRLYERMGLIEPKRRGHARLFSDADIERIRRIQHLTQDLGVNLAGVEIVFKLLEEMDRMRRDMTSEMDAIREEMQHEIDNMLRRLGIDPRQPAAGVTAGAPTGNGGEQIVENPHPRNSGEVRPGGSRAVRIPVEKGE